MENNSKNLLDKYRVIEKNNKKTRKKKQSKTKQKTAATTTKKPAEQQANIDDMATYMAGSVDLSREPKDMSNIS